MSIFDLHASKARYELKVVLVKRTPGFINIPLADFFIDKLAP